MLWGHLERLTGIEPAYQAWEASALPLSYSRSGTGLNSSRESRSTRITLPQSRAFSEQITQSQSLAAHSSVCHRWPPNRPAERPSPSNGRVDVRKSKYMWLGTDLVCEASKFFVKDAAGHQW